MMSDPKLHHYVPRFYLQNFCDGSHGFWVWDKCSRQVYRSAPQGVAAQKHFYRVPEFIGTEVDPLFLERDLSSLEGDAASILREWIPSLSDMQPMDRLELSDDARRAFSIFVAVQFLRTADHRDILALFAEETEEYKNGVSKEERVNLHAQMLCSGGLVETISDRVFKSIWIFAKNTTGTPFWTSDNPVCFKTKDNRMWLKGPGVLSEGSYVVFPLTPSFILYCKEPSYWAAVARLDCRLSPVTLDDDMIKHENAGQVFMATRHLIASVNDFEWADEFAATIGTDIYAPKEGEPSGEPEPPMTRDFEA